MRVGSQFSGGWGGQLPAAPRSFPGVQVSPSQPSDPTASPSPSGSPSFSAPSASSGSGAPAPVPSDSVPTPVVVTPTTPPLPPVEAWTPAKTDALVWAAGIVTFLLAAILVTLWGQS